MIDDYEDDELAETGKVEASDDEALDDFEPTKLLPNPWESKYSSDAL